MKLFLPKFYELLERNLGIALDDSKHYLIESRLLPIVERSEFEDVSSLIRYLAQNNVGPLHWQVFELLTTNETSFFRDKHVFDLLKTSVLPQLIERNQNFKKLNIWNAAVSSGQEAYSIAMLIREHFPQLNDWEINIHGTDISKLMLDRAKLGVYTKHEVSRGVDERMLKKYFSLYVNGGYQIQDSIRDMTKFSSLNLIADWSMPTQYDLIMLRNVLIYFNNQTQQMVLEKIHRYLNLNHGFLFIGASESTSSIHYRREIINGTYCYRPI